MKNSETLGHVMLIDDEKFDRKMYQRTLERYRIADSVSSFAHAEEALMFLCDPTNPEVDLILLDINMPRMNGFEFLDALQDRFGTAFDATIAIMLTTPLPEKERQRAAGSPLIDAFFGKPLTLEDIQTALRMVAAKRALASMHDDGLMDIGSRTQVGGRPDFTAQRPV